MVYIHTYMYIHILKKKLEFLIIDSLTNVTNRIFFIYYKDNTKLQIYKVINNFQLTTYKLFIKKKIYRKLNFKKVDENKTTFLI
jgi:hypothetical protein